MRPVRSVIVQLHSQLEFFLFAQLDAESDRVVPHHTIERIVCRFQPVDFYALDRGSRRALPAPLHALPESPSVILAQSLPPLAANLAETSTSITTSRPSLVSCARITT